MMTALLSSPLLPIVARGLAVRPSHVSEYQEVVETLVDYAENGIPEGEAEEYSPAETIRRTIRVEDGLVSFRTRSGKGSKPAKIPAAQFAEVAQLLASTMAPVAAAGEQLSPATEGGDEE